MIFPLLFKASFILCDMHAIFKLISRFSAKK